MGVPSSPRRRERGSALLVTLIVMTLMVLASLSFSRSTNTANLIAGNTAFKQAATQAAEIGVDAAGKFIAERIDRDTTQDGVYYSTQLAQDGDELPLGIDWDSQVPRQQVGNFNVQFIVERMCSLTPVTDPVTQCAGRTTPVRGSQKAGTPTMQGPPVIYYRATVRVTGPRNAESLVQAAFSR
jgi:Tfp pilus assembly protein PilX